MLFSHIFVFALKNYFKLLFVGFNFLFYLLASSLAMLILGSLVIKVGAVLIPYEIVFIIGTLVMFVIFSYIAGSLYTQYIETILLLVRQGDATTYQVFHPRLDIKKSGRMLSYLTVISLLPSLIFLPSVAYYFLLQPLATNIELMTFLALFLVSFLGYVYLLQIWILGVYNLVDKNLGVWSALKNSKSCVLKIGFFQVLLFSFILILCPSIFSMYSPEYGSMIATIILMPFSSSGYALLYLSQEKNEDTSENIDQSTQEQEPPQNKRDSVIK